MSASSITATITRFFLLAISILLISEKMTSAFNSFIVKICNNKDCKNIITDNKNYIKKKKDKKVIKTGEVFQICTN